MPETVVIDSPQVGATAFAKAEEAPIINRPEDTQEQQPPPKKEPSAPPLSLADSIRAKFKAGKKPDETKDDTKTAVKNGKAEVKKPDAEKPKADKKPKPESRHTVDPIKIAEAQGREIGDRILSGMKKPEPQQAPEPSDDDIAKTLPEEYRADVAVYNEMKRLFPDKHGKILNGLAEAAKKETRYIEEWEKQHPDEDYNPDDTAHNAFYKKNFPEIPERDFEAAKTSLNDARIEAKIDSKYRSEIEQLKRGNAADKIAPLIQQRVGDVIESALGAIDETLTAIARDPVKLNALQETNPVAADVVWAVHQTFSPLMTANVSIHQGTIEIDPKNPVHIELFTLAQKIEQKTAASPLEQRMDSEGRVFATRAQYNRMSTEEQAAHWFVDQDVLAYVISKKAASSAKEWFDASQEKYKKWAKANGVALPSAAKTTQIVKPEDAEEPPIQEETPSSPSVPGRGQVPSPWSQNETGPKTGREMFLKRLRGG